MSIKPARPASTVVLVRPSTRRFDVFLVRRHDNIAFLGGAHVFPGGRVYDADRIDDPSSLCDGVEAALARLPDVPPADTVGHFVAAVRELFEEAGVLLARTADGSYVSVDNDRFREDRRALATGGIAIAALAVRERLRLALDQLVHFAHWVTPEIEIKRFDARFFMATVPAGQEPVHDDHELTHGAWFDPEEALAECDRGAIALPPPTWTTLRILSRCSTVDEALAWARHVRIVRVQPGLTDQDGRMLLTLPGDRLHPPVAGAETPEVTRFVLDEGRWRPST